MGLRAFVAPVQDRMVAIMAKAERQDAPSFDMGWRAALLRHEALPRIVWVPRGGPTQPDATGGNDVTTGRRIATRKPILDVHIRGVDIDDCEILAGFLIDALQDEVWGSYRVVNEDWGIGEENEDTKDSQLFVLSVEVHIPWVRQLTPATRRTVTLDVTPSDPINGS